MINESNSINNNTNGKNTQNFDKQNEVNNTNSKEIDIERLQRELKDAIKEERYEDAAKIRDELKKFQ